MTGSRRGATSAAVLLVVVVMVLTACGDNEASEVEQLGDPPTLDWPRQLSCPASLQSVCNGKELQLVTTVNVSRETIVNAATSASATHVLCVPPISEEGACNAIPSKGASVTGEAAIYAVPL